MINLAHRIPFGKIERRCSEAIRLKTLGLNGSIYYYAVTAHDINGNESSKSASVKGGNSLT
jgi:hypothetical protein